MMDWPQVELDQLADIRGGATPSRSNTSFWNGDIPWVTPTDLPKPGEGVVDVENTADTITGEALASCSASLMPPGTVLFSTRASIGKIGIAAVPLSTNQGFANLIPLPCLESRYLAWCLHFYAGRIASLAGSTTFKEVPKSALKRFRIPLPPLSKQRRIVAILDQADRLRRLRVEANAKAERILSALFIRRFGEPSSNTMGWPVRPLGEVGDLDRGRSRHRPRNDPKLLGGPYPLVQTAEVANSGGRIREYSQTYSEFGLAQSRIWPAGTLCITIAANIARTGVLEFSACFPDSVVGFVPGPNITTEYVQFFLFHVRRLLERDAPQVAQKNINLKVLKSLMIPLPPMEFQRQFSTHVGLQYNCCSRQATGQIVLNQLFTSTMARVFSGNLPLCQRKIQRSQKTSRNLFGRPIS